MNINYGSTTISRVDDIESGVVFKYDNDFYITTTHYNFDIGKRTCVNVAIGTLKDIPLNIVVEPYYNSYVTIKGGE